MDAVGDRLVYGSSRLNYVIISKRINSVYYMMLESKSKSENKNKTKSNREKIRKYKK